MNKNITIYYFSGTGSSRWVADRIAKDFAEKDYTAQIINIEESQEYVASTVVGFVFPTYAFGLPKNCVDFMRTFKPKDGQKTFAVATATGFEGIALYQMRRYMRKMGCEILGGRVIYTPSTYVIMRYDPSIPEFEDILNSARQDIRCLVSDLCRNNCNFKKPNFFLHILTGFFYVWFLYVGRKVGGKLFTVDDKKCNGCGECARICAGKGITMCNGKPKWSWGCLQCFRCFHECPQEAVEISGWSLLFVVIMLILGLHVYSGAESYLLVNFPKWINWSLDIAFWLIAPVISVAITSFLTDKGLMPKWYATKNRKRMHEKDLIENSNKLGL